MARFNLSFLAFFFVFAVLVLSSPIKRDDATSDQKLSLETALDDVKAATKMMQGFDNSDSNDQKNQINNADDDTKTDGEKPETEKKVNEATPTHTKKTSGNFATPTPTNTHKPTSQPNALGNLPILGGLLGGTGGL
ncbi:hypothetical protein N7468_003243 [Penicillium chermesinum]|uniref:Uncharacterized protein n=1 Tax=Penicillium chermesinum TaxID=63820 RepID=A0A9W9P621_9EURO|nr:uncharacterized protein N7468_003243 [Penicillium chermesinum]KAJ5238624.1 hypothetical protein N7468_003243 [Penicillium chermesinum]KAJ6164273.1 hypothetical protein N7470_002945 [Penicillium chermesinum]